MKLSEITDKEHFKNMLKDPKMAEVEKQLIKSIPMFKERGWNLTYELDQDVLAKQPIFRVEFTLGTEDPDIDLNLNSDKVLMNRLFPHIFMTSVTNTQESKMIIVMYPHHKS